MKDSQSEVVCVRSFHGRIPPGLEAAGGLSGGKGGDGRRPRNMGGGRGIWEVEEEYGRRKRNMGGNGV